MRHQEDRREIKRLQQELRCQKAANRLLNSGEDNREGSAEQRWMA
jgi:hypothetical protein